MPVDKAHWPELAKVYENLLCSGIGLAKPLKQHGKLVDSLKTLVNALSPSTKKKDEVYRYPDRTKTIIIQLDWAPLGIGPESRNRVRINPDHITLLWNAILLQGVFGEPKLVAEFLKPTANRQPLVDWARQLFLERQTVAGLGFLRQRLLEFLDRLPVANLNQERLPNPFADTLPQMGLGHLHGNLLRALATQTAALSLGDSMMAHYLSGDLEQAYAKACELETQNELLLQYRDLISKEYQERKGFHDFLRGLRKM
ncbi:hypothetical protein SAMN05216296_0016 [Pseudomonas pohangensis]|uniref:Uncharacterized protein n=1 Tax=Pseudomonas pohangensis TaxID=364197 RepID=A0A1H2DUP2_9PSED|nr:hypothetical protein [Pseudomonas pohangensis]SDT86541.1 hypothetical protein SAMN05216296_0016 [Pseudomonas pohangensis]